MNTSSAYAGDPRHAEQFHREQRRQQKCDSAQAIVTPLCPYAGNGRGIAQAIDYDRPKTDPAPTVSDATDRLEKTIAHLCERIEHTENRLCSVLRPVGPCDTVNGATPEHNDPLAVGRLRHLEGTVQGLVARVSDMIDRLAL
jgi:hypothetical protein